MKKQLTDEEVQQIRNIYSVTNVTQKDLAFAFQITQPHISRLVRNLRRKVALVATK